MRATLICVKKAATQNVTLSLPKSVLRKAKVLAAQRETSISALLTQALEDLVNRDDAYRGACAQALEELDRGFAMGTQGCVTWTRDELHER